MPSGPDLLPNVCPRGGGDAAAAHAEMAPDEQVPTVRLRRNRGRARYRPPPPRPPQLVAAALRLGEGWAGSPAPRWSIFRGCALARMWSGAQ